MTHDSYLCPMSSPRIVFMGTPEFAVASLGAIVRAGMNVVAVVTTPDKPAGRGLTVRESAVKSFARQHALPVLEPASLRDKEFESALRALEPDIFVVVAFKILPASLLNIPKLGAFNVHASLLPRYRGAAPINWAIIRGEHETGVTTFFLRDTVDTGAIILQQKIAIADDDDAGTLHAKLAALGADAVVKTIERIAEGNVKTEKQDDAQATAAPKIFRDDCKIDWNRPAHDIRNFIRGLSPYPAAFTAIGDKEAKIFRTAVAPQMKIDPAALHINEKKLFIGTATEALEILDLQPEAKRRMSAEEFLRGWRGNVMSHES